MDEEEQEYFQKCVFHFSNYEKYFIERCESKIAMLKNAPQRHQPLLADHAKSFERMKISIRLNQVFLNQVVAEASSMFNTLDESYNPLASKNNGVNSRKVDKDQMSRVETTLRQIVRDWSSVGEEERRKCYGPVLEALSKYIKPDNDTAPSVLVPGCGLSRLVWEIARRGYACEGNEFSSYMLYTSHFILNRIADVDSRVVYPFVHDTCNVLATNDLFGMVRFPDVNPSAVGAGGHKPQLSMSAGDFVEVYAGSGRAFDAVCCVFFLDTSHNILEYLEILFDILKPGGYLINLGPLLYHFSDMPNETSIELPYSEIHVAMNRIGFEIVEEETGVDCTYLVNPTSMLNYAYNFIFYMTSTKDLTRDHVFDVTIVDKPCRSDIDIPLKLNQPNEYTLTFSPDGITIRSRSGHLAAFDNNALFWSYRVVRKFGRKKPDVFVFESGRSGPTGEGEFRVRYKSCDELFNMFKTVTESQRQPAPAPPTITRPEAPPEDPVYAISDADGEAVYDTALLIAPKPRKLQDRISSSVQVQAEAVASKENDKPELIYSQLITTGSSGSGDKADAGGGGAPVLPRKTLNRSHLDTQNFLTSPDTVEYVEVSSPTYKQEQAAGLPLFREADVADVEYDNIVAPPPPIEIDHSNLAKSSKKQSKPKKEKKKK